MVKTNKLITLINRTKMTKKYNEWIVIHYVGAVSSAKANANYFYSAKRQASANYFVDENEIWQVVDDKDAAWHVGAKKYYNACRNTNSIGIELCCKKDPNGNWYFEEATIQNAIELTRMLMQKYSIPIERVCRHYDVTHKICPEPFVRDSKAWQNFLSEVQNMDEEKELTVQEKTKEIQRIGNFDDNTGLYLQFYRYNVPLIDKLYLMAKDAEKWRNQAKN